METNLEKLQREMPLVFELRNDLVRKVAEETADYHIKIDRLRIYLDRDEFEIERRSVYDKFQASLAPIRAHIDSINSKIADCLAAMPPERIVVQL